MPFVLGTNSTQDEGFLNTCVIFELSWRRELICMPFVLGTNSTQDEGFSNTCVILELSWRRQ